MRNSLARAAPRSPGRMGHGAGAGPGFAQRGGRPNGRVWELGWSEGGTRFDGATFRADGRYDESGGITAGTSVQTRGCADGTERTRDDLDEPSPDDAIVGRD